MRRLVFTLSATLLLATLATPAAAQPMESCDPAIRDFYTDFFDGIGAVFKAAGPEGACRTPDGAWEIKNDRGEVIDAGRCENGIPQGTLEKKVGFVFDEVTFTNGVKDGLSTRHRERDGLLVRDRAVYENGVKNGLARRELFYVDPKERELPPICWPENYVPLAEVEHVAGAATECRVWTAETHDAHFHRIANAPTVAPEPTHDQIARRAHSIWEREGRPQGRDVANWLAAEAELRAELREAATVPATPAPDAVVRFENGLPVVVSNRLGLSAAELASRCAVE